MNKQEKPSSPAPVQPLVGQVFINPVRKDK